MKHYTLLSRTNYLHILADLALAAKPGERIIIATMSFNPHEPLVAELVEALCQAARQGANVTLIIDAYNFLLNSHDLPGPLFYGQSPERAGGTFAATFAALQSLRISGGAYHITNIPRRAFTFPKAGRSHVKGAVIGNHVFVGGCNLEEPQQIDIMVSWENTEAAKQLTTWLVRMTEDESVRNAFGDVDTEAQLDPSTRLILDAGVPGQSLIYDEALSLIDEAREWVLITCQYFPGGPTARHLAAAARRGVQVEIDYNHPRSHGSEAPLHHLHQITQHVKRLPRVFFAGRLDKRAPKLHAKVLASEKAAMAGSHNYVIQGVRFGTAELTLRSTDPAFSNALRTFVHSQLPAITEADPDTTTAASQPRA